jgi:hypothetical protein
MGRCCRRRPAALQTPAQPRPAPYRPSPQDKKALDALIDAAALSWKERCYPDTGFFHMRPSLNPYPGVCPTSGLFATLPYMGVLCQGDDWPDELPVYGATPREAALKLAARYEELHHAWDPEGTPDAVKQRIRRAGPGSWWGFGGGRRAWCPLRVHDDVSRGSDGLGFGGGRTTPCPPAAFAGRRTFTGEGAARANQPGPDQ